MLSLAFLVNLDGRDIFFSTVHSNILCTKVSLLFNYFDIYKTFLDADIPISTPSRTIYQYETIASPFRTFYQNTSQQPAYVSFESIPPSIDKDNSLTPPFQKKLPIIPVIVLGFCEILGGLIVLTLEVLVFDLAVGLWCGFIYALAGIAALILG